MLKMKSYKVFILIFIIGILTSCQNKEVSTFKTSNINKGTPEILESIVKSLPFKIKSYSKLETSNDTVQIYFGGLSQENQSGNWLALSLNNQLKQFTTITLTPNPKTEKENNFDIQFNNSEYRVSLRIKNVDTVHNKVTYSWSDFSNLTDSLIVQKLDKPLSRGNTFPKIELTDLKGENFNLYNHKGKIIVINWWATACAPCREEIPGLNKLVDKYDKQNIMFVAIADDSKNRVSHFLKKNEFKYDMVFAPKEGRKVFGNSYPKNLIIDSSFNVIYYSEGGNKLKWKEIDNYLIKHLNK